MTSRLKIDMRKLIVLSAIAIFGWWAFFNHENNNAHPSLHYTRKHYNRDVTHVHFSLGKSAEARFDHASAIQSYQTALETDPENIVIHDHLGKELELANNVNAALKVYLEAMAISPEFIETRFTHDVISERKKNPELKNLESQSWAGQKLYGKTVYVYAEKGLGDTICFCRFLPELTKRGAHVFFKPQQQLTSYLRDNNLEIEILEHDADVSLLNLDYHVSLLALPHFLGIDLQSLPTPHQYLTADSKRAKIFKQKLFRNNKFNVGIVWQNNSIHDNDHRQSIPLSQFYCLGRVAGVKLFSLQKGFGLKQLEAAPLELGMVNLDRYIKNFEDTAALIQNLDLIITIDSTIVHLAGALGKPVWMLTPHVTDWRWLGYTHNKHTPWYESLRKRQQNQSDNWLRVFDAVRLKLKHKIDKQRRRRLII